MKPGLDRFGNIVSIGDEVRILSIRPSILKRLGASEQAHLESMLNAVHPVFDVYDDGLTWVSLTWRRPDGDVEIHAIAVDPDQIELVRQKES